MDEPGPAVDAERVPHKVGSTAYIHPVGPNWGGGDIKEVNTDRPGGPVSAVPTCSLGMVAVPGSNPGRAGLGMGSRNP